MHIALLKELMKLNQPGVYKHFISYGIWVSAKLSRKKTQPCYTENAEVTKRRESDRNAARASQEARVTFP
jgi:hypothetical protein